MTTPAVLLAVLTAVLFAVRLGLLATLHVVGKQYNPVEHAVSDYAVGSTNRLASAMTWCTAAAWVALAVAVAVGLPDWHDRVGVVIQLAVLAVAFIALPYVPTDLEGERRTARGMLHYLLAIVWFALAYTLTSSFADLVQQHDGALAGVLRVLHYVILIALIAVIAGLILPQLRKRFGLIERVFIVAVGLFYLLASIALILL